VRSAPARPAFVCLPKQHCGPALCECIDVVLITAEFYAFCVLAETLWVLDAVYHRSPAQIANAVDRMLNHKELTLQDAQVVALALDHFRSRPSLGFSDCLVLEIARKAGHLPLGTFDRSLARLDGTHRL
jgi:predicted nucleic-acid-binding protein